MKIFETPHEVMDIPFSSSNLDFDDIQADFPEFILIGYKDKAMLEENPISDIESIMFCVDTSKELDAPRITLDAFLKQPDFLRGEDVKSFDVTFSQSEQDELQRVLLKVFCNMLYGAKLYN